MSEVQDSILISALTGFFTVFGLIIGAVLEHWREKQRYGREKEREQKETEKETNRSYLSPLFFHIIEINATSYLISPKTFEELKKGLTEVEKLQNEIIAIKELMKNNMHVLPKDLNFSLAFYANSYMILLEALNDLSSGLDQLNKEAQRKDIPKGLLEGLETLKTVFDEMTATMAAHVYAFMKYNISAAEKPINRKEISKRIKEAIATMRASLTSEIEKG